MAREMVQSLHYIHFNSWKALGFTLLELIMTLAIVAILVSAAAPSFSNLIESNKVKRLATEIEWLLVQAKSEAVMRGEALKITPKSMAATSSAAANKPSWSIEVTEPGGMVINKLSNEEFKDVKIYTTFSPSGFDIDKLAGHIKADGKFVFFIDNKNKNVIVKHNQMTGRLVSCSDGGAYGYKKCP